MRGRLLALLLANAGFAAGLWQVWSAAPPPLATRPPPQPFAAPPLPALAELAALPAGRSFFRSPQPEPARPASPPPPAQPKLRLVGVLLIEGRPLALVEVEGAGTRRVGEGDEVAGWRVQAIRAREMTLAQDERQAAYPLDLAARR